MSEDSESRLKTLASYEEAAGLYITKTPAEVPLPLQDFLASVCERLEPGARILELGSGPGYDAALLEARGFRVRRTDGTRAFVDALRRQGHEAEVLDVVTDPLGGPHDLIYANAVFPHLTGAELTEVLTKARAGVASDGLLAFTVKEGDGDTWTTVKLDVPRYFRFWREGPLRDLLVRTGWTHLSLRHVHDPVDDWIFVSCAPA